MKITIIGMTGSMSGPDSAASSYLVQAKGTGEDGHPRTFSVVFDMGPGSFGQLCHYMDPSELDAVVLSHLHADHCGDIMSLQIFSRWHPSANMEQIPLYAPAGALERLRGLDGFAGNDDFSTEFEILKLRQGHTFQVGPMKITPYAAWHSVPAYALRVQGPSSHDENETAVFTYTGDTDLCEPVVDAARGADLLLSECGFTPAVEVRGIHLTGERAGRVAQEAGAKHLVLTHIQPWTDPWMQVTDARKSFSGELEVAAPGRLYVI